MTAKGISISVLASAMMCVGAVAQVDTAYERDILRALGELPAPEYATNPLAEIAPDRSPFPRRDPRTGGAPLAASATTGESDSLAKAVIKATADRAAARRNAPWIYTEGIARAIRREYLTFLSPGRVAYVDPALREGVRVQAGQRLAYQEQSRTTAEIAASDARVVDAQTQLAVARASEGEAMANLRLATKTYERFKTLIEQQSASQQEFDQAKAQLESAHAAAVKTSRQITSMESQIAVAAAQRAQADVVKKDSELVSPIAGVIARFNIEQGYYFSPQLVQTGSEQAALETVPVVIIDTSQFEISLKIRSELFDDLTVGAQALLDIVDEDATLEERLPNEIAGPQRPASAFPVEGTIYSISPSFDTETRTFNVKVRTTRGAEKLRDGENVALWVKKGQGAGQGTIYAPVVFTPPPALPYGQPETIYGNPATADPIMNQPGLVYD